MAALQGLQMVQNIKRLHGVNLKSVHSDALRSESLYHCQSWLITCRSSHCCALVRISFYQKPQLFKESRVPRS